MTVYTHIVLERVTGTEFKVGPHNKEKYRNAVEFITLDKPVSGDSKPVTTAKRKASKVANHNSVVSSVCDGGRAKQFQLFLNSAYALAISSRSISPSLP